MGGKRAPDRCFWADCHPAESQPGTGGGRDNLLMGADVGLKRKGVEKRRRRNSKAESLRFFLAILIQQEKRRVSGR